MDKKRSLEESLQGLQLQRETLEEKSKMNKAKMESQIWEHRDKNHNAEVNLEQLWKIQESLETKLEE